MADRKLYTFDEWADPNEWNPDTGAPGIMHFANAVQLWAVFQNRTGVTVGDAADAFNVSPRRIAEAVDAHPWMFMMGAGRMVTGEDDLGRRVPLPDLSDAQYRALTIEHEGE